MYVRAILAWSLTTLVGSLAVANDNEPKVGDRVIIVMRGDVARDYGRRHGIAIPPNSKDLEISSVAKVVERPTAEKAAIELQSHSRQEGQKDRLITLATTVELPNLSIQVTPKGTPTYASPAEAKSGVKPSLTVSEVKTYVVTITDASKVKMQTWELAE